jgi:GNAT superfamily N-acetyltransferase
MDSISIVPLPPNQIDQLIAVAERAWHAHYPGIISVEQIEYMLKMGYTRQLILNEIERDGVTWLSIADGTNMIGFISAGPYGAGTMKLHKLYLLPEYQGKGIGAMALATVEQLARSANAHRLVLNVNKQNAKAIRSYERAGWRISEEVTNDIGNGFVMDDFVMTKLLESPL